MEVITYSEWINQGNRQIAQEIALLAAQAGADGVVDMDTYTNFPTEGADGLLYLAKDTGKLYTWNSTSKSYVRVDAGSDYVLPEATDEVLGGVKFGAIGGTACEGNDARLSDDRTPKYHTHGDITNDGKIGTTPNLVVVTGTGGSVSAKTAGTTNQYLRGDGSWGTPPDNNTTYSVGDGGLTQNNFTTTLKNKLDGIASGATVNVSTNLSTTHNTTTVVVNSSDGDNATINGATDTTAGVMTSTDKIKLDSHTHGNITNDGKIGENAGAGVVITDSNGVIDVVASGAEGQFLAYDGSWATLPNAVSNISLDTSTERTELTGAPEVSDGNGIIWYDSTEGAEGFNITIKLEGYEPATIELSTGALEPPVDGE